MQQGDIELVANKVSCLLLDKHKKQLTELLARQYDELSAEVARQLSTIGTVDKQEPEDKKVSLSPPLIPAWSRLRASTIQLNKPGAISVTAGGSASSTPPSSFSTSPMSPVSSAASSAEATPLSQSPNASPMLRARNFAVSSSSAFVSGKIQTSDVKSMKETMKQLKQNFIRTLLLLAKKSHIYVNMFDSMFSHNSAHVNIKPGDYNLSQWGFELSIQMINTNTTKTKVTLRNEKPQRTLSTYDSTLNTLVFEADEIGRICKLLWSDITQRISDDRNPAVADWDDDAEWHSDS